MMMVYLYFHKCASTLKYRMAYAKNLCNCSVEHILGSAGYNSIVFNGDMNIQQKIREYIYLLNVMK